MVDPALTLPLQIETRSSLNSRLANIHLERQDAVTGAIDFTYKPCGETSKEHNALHYIGRTMRPSHNRLVWIIPENAMSGGCILAHSNLTGLLVGQSEPQRFDLSSNARGRNARKSSQQGVRMDNSTGVDVWGPWFEGVELLKNRDDELAAVDAKFAKRKNIAIVGAGMSGLMTYLCLMQQGMTNVHLIEAGNSLGGRVRTVYFSGGPFDYSYQEMGPMRLPTTITVDGQTFNASDHQLVFQLANEMNILNGHDKNLAVDFIPWYETNVNLPHMDGLPGMAQLLQEVNAALPGRDFCVELATNMFKAHRKWLDSEYAFSSNDPHKTRNPKLAASQFRGRGASSLWDKLCETVYLNSTTWTTIDGGMSRLPLSFHPLVDDSTTFNRHIDRVNYSPDSKTVTLESKGSNCTLPKVNSTHDYAIITERSPRPVFGSCWAPGPKSPGIGTVCYPSYNINGTGKAAVLASYISDPIWSAHWATKSEQEHVAYVLNAMVGHHGNIARRQYTGKHSRVCWSVDPLEGAGWADPTAEQQRKYLPEYFKTHNNIIFVGEHTSYTHAWIASALESGIRGSVQLLLELGLVDEAKAVVEKWMARWIDVVSQL
ncbi:putative L-amino-acid oxidase [Podospora aff. communis PSN243]|uniref:L-amino-acid oxidase n=1 Tax=Podospora aff. communis PSN243 TaxID=3040156 RepID=A0AAV9GEX5_9PEZI|nr:putative L-amino-acid oxidase [Podospora aff. communis PSN243]